MLEISFPEHDGLRLCEQIPEDIVYVVAEQRII
jgi:hypothetical protein